MWGSSAGEDAQCLGCKDTTSCLPQKTPSNYKLYNAWKFQTSTANKSPFLHVIGYRGQQWTLVTHGNKMQGSSVRNHCSNRWPENKYHYHFRPFVEVQLHAIYPGLSKIKLVPVAPKSMPLTPIYWWSLIQADREMLWPATYTNVCKHWKNGVTMACQELQWLSVKSQNKIALLKEFRRRNIMLTLNQYTALKIEWWFYWSLQVPIHKYSTAALPRLSNAVKRDTYIYRKKEELPQLYFCWGFNI